MFRHFKLFMLAALAALVLPGAALAANHGSHVKGGHASKSRAVKGTVLQVDRAHHLLRVVEGLGRVESFRVSGQLAGTVRPGAVVTLQARGHSASAVQPRSHVRKLEVLGRVVSSSAKGLVVSLPDGRLFTVGTSGHTARARAASDTPAPSISLNIQGLTPGELVLITVDFGADGSISITVALQPGQAPVSQTPPPPPPSDNGSGDGSGDQSGSQDGSSDGPSCPASNTDDGKVLGVNHTNGTFTIGATWSEDTVYTAPASVLNHIHQGDYVLVMLDPATPGAATNALIVSSSVSAPDPGVQTADGTVGGQDSTAGQFVVAQSNHNGTLTFDAPCWILNQVWTSEDVHVIYHQAANGDLVADAVDANDGSEF